MRYLIVKGWLGFGDRLESLKMAVAYAQRFQLKIYVDWRDSIWSHGNESFYTYFKLVNIPLLTSLSDIPEDATVYPAYWKDHMDEQISSELLAKSQDYGLDLGVLATQTFPADVVVFSSIGKRTVYPDSKFFCDVFRLTDSRVLQKLRDRESRYPIQKSWGIHIRGTDRLLKPHKREISVQSLCSVLINYGAMNGVPMTVVSDDKESISVWKRFYPQSFIVSELSLQQSSAGGNHNMPKDQLKYSKDEMNVDMLVDFFTLAVTDRIFSTCKDSRFTHEARRLHPYVRTILKMD